MLKGKVAVVTGSSRGIGRAIALAFVKNGAKVVLNHTRSGRDIDNTRALLDETGAQYLVCKGSVADRDFVNHMFEESIGRFGCIDILVNNAGITNDKPLSMMSEADWDKVMDSNLKSVYLCSKGVIKPMMKQKSGRIINISSISAISGRPGQCHYASTKAGMIGFTKSLAREVGRYNILVNALFVGVIDTVLTKRMQEKQRRMIIDLIPQGRIGQPEEVAGPALFLASDLSTFVTGTTVNVSGGGYT